MAVASASVWAPVQLLSWWQAEVKGIIFDRQPTIPCGSARKMGVHTGASTLAGPTHHHDRLSDIVYTMKDCSDFDDLPRLRSAIATRLQTYCISTMFKSSPNRSFSLMALVVAPRKDPLHFRGGFSLHRWWAFLCVDYLRSGFVIFGIGVYPSRYCSWLGRVFSLKLGMAPAEV